MLSVPLGSRRLGVGACGSGALKGGVGDEPRYSAPIPCGGAANMPVQSAKTTRACSLLPGPVAARLGAATVMVCYICKKGAGCKPFWGVGGWRWGSWSKNVAGGFRSSPRGRRPRELQDQRRHQGRGMNGRTLMRALLRGCQKTSDTEVTGETNTARLKPEGILVQLRYGEMITVSGRLQRKELLSKRCVALANCRR